LVTAFVQDKPTIERGLFDEELVPEELTQLRMGKIIKQKVPQTSMNERSRSGPPTRDRCSQPGSTS
jgi:hypothetical protein